MSKIDSNNEDGSVNTPLRGSPMLNYPEKINNQSTIVSTNSNNNLNKISLDQIASSLLKQNFVLTALGV
jgi:hypothetical protein